MMKFNKWVLVLLIEIVVLCISYLLMTIYGCSPCNATFDLLHPFGQPIISDQIVFCPAINCHFWFFLLYPVFYLTADITIVTLIIAFLRKFRP